MKKPTKGDTIVFTARHPFRIEGDVFGTVTNVDGNIVIVNTLNGDTDRIVWNWPSGDVNPFYAVESNRSLF